MQRDYNGSLEDLMKFYLSTKEIIMDRSFDGLYLKLCMEGKEFKEAIEKFLGFDKIITTHLNVDKADQRIKMLLNCFTEIYENLADRNKRSIMEATFIKQVREFAQEKIALSIKNTISLLKIMLIIAKNTNTEDHFKQVVNIFIDEIVTPRKTTKGSLQLAKDKSDTLISNEALKGLFTLFQDNYLKPFTTQLKIILKSLIQLVHILLDRKCNRCEEIVKLILEFFANIEYDHNEDLKIRRWNVASCLSAIGDEESSFPAEFALSIALNIVKENSNTEFVEVAGEVMISIFRSSYKFNNINIPEVIDTVADRKGSFINEIKPTELRNIVKLQELMLTLALQQDPIGKRTSGHYVTIEETSKIFEEYLSDLDIFFNMLITKVNPPDLTLSIGRPTGNF